MKNYYITNNATGAVVRQGVCQEVDFSKQAQENETAHEGEINVPKASWYDETNYRNQRFKAYQGPGEQLDAIFKMAQALSQAGTELPADTQAWIDNCAAVKAQFPK